MDLTNRAVYLLTPKGAKLAQKAIDDIAAGKKKWAKFMRKYGSRRGVISCGRKLIGILYAERPDKPPQGWRYAERFHNGVEPAKNTAEGKAVAKAMAALELPAVPAEVVGETTSWERLPVVHYTIIHRVGKRYYVLACDKTKNPPPHGKKIKTSTYMKHVESTADTHQTYLNCEYP